jgi:RNA polymerase sigma-70 factor (ECF subfamily)
VETDIRNLADEEVMQLVQRGDPRAFELLYDRHAGAAFSLAYRIVGKRSTAEDVVQEALLSIWRSRLR